MSLERYENVGTSLLQPTRHTIYLLCREIRLIGVNVAAQHRQFSVRTHCARQHLEVMLIQLPLPLSCTRRRCPKCTVGVAPVLGVDYSLYEHADNHTLSTHTYSINIRTHGSTDIRAFIANNTQIIIRSINKWMGNTHCKARIGYLLSATQACRRARRQTQRHNRCPRPRNCIL